MTLGFSYNGLKCPYCDERFPSHRDLRSHVGAAHREKTDEFMEEYFGGRWIEADFITLMLQRAMGDLSEEYCEKCGKCAAGCAIPVVFDGLPPYKVSTKVMSGKVKELLKSDVIWACTSCLACEEQCPADMSPHEVVSVLKNLSARIGYHYPRGYRDLDRNISRLGVIQKPKAALARSGERFDREALGLPVLQGPTDMGKFNEALDRLSGMRVVL
jgi:heterodisulfide reductase subunit C